MHKKHLTKVNTFLSYSRVAGGVDQKVMEPSTKPDDPSLISRTYMVEGEN